MANQDFKQKKNDVMGMDPSQERAQDAQNNSQMQTEEEAGAPSQGSQKLEQDSNRQAQGRDRNQDAQGRERTPYAQGRESQNTEASEAETQEFPHQTVAENSGRESGNKITGQREEGTGGYGGTEDQGRSGNKQSEVRGEDRKSSGNEANRNQKKRDVA